MNTMGWRAQVMFGTWERPGTVIEEHGDRTVDVVVNGVVLYGLPSRYVPVDEGVALAEMLDEDRRLAPGAG